jgi:hypothetical protein
MPPAAKTRQKKKTPQRTVRLVRAPVDGIGVFLLQVRKEETYYTFCEIPCEIGGRGFALHRLGVGALYHVRIGAASECSCDCLGFLAHGACKHVLSLLALEAEGLI